MKLTDEQLAQLPIEQFEQDDPVYWAERLDKITDIFVEKFGKDWFLKISIINWMKRLEFILPNDIMPLFSFVSAKMRTKRSILPADMLDNFKEYCIRTHLEYELKKIKKSVTQECVNSIYAVFEQYQTNGGL